jgi:hypothetical protein
LIMTLDLTDEEARALGTFLHRAIDDDPLLVLAAAGAPERDPGEARTAGTTRDAARATSGYPTLTAPRKKVPI